MRIFADPNIDYNSVAGIAWMVMVISVPEHICIGSMSYTKVVLATHNGGYRGLNPALMLVGIS